MLCLATPLLLIQQPTTQVGYSFTIPYLYGGMVFAGIPDYAECADTLNVNGTCADVRVCVVDGSTYVDRVTELLPDASLTVTPMMNALYERLRDGICNVLAGDQFEVSQSAVEQIGYFGDYAVGTTLFSKEPLALVTREEDPTWSDFVNWVIQGLLAAEEQEFTQERASFFTQDPVFGDEFGSMFINALTDVGNYEEMVSGIATNFAGRVTTITHQLSSFSTRGTWRLYCRAQRQTQSTMEQVVSCTQCHLETLLPVDRILLMEIHCKRFLAEDFCAVVSHAELYLHSLTLCPKSGVVLMLIFARLCQLQSLMV